MLKKIIVPEKSEFLAEECGIHYGDGYMKIRKDKWGTHYEYFFASHTQDDINYREYVKNLMKKLYDLKPTADRSYGNDASLTFSCKELINFKLSIGMLLSPKIDLTVPRWIKENKEFLRNFLRGLFDTDGCLSFKSKNGNPHNYPVIHLKLSDKNLIEEIQESLESFSLNSCLVKYFQLDKRTNKVYLGYGLDISGHENLQTFLMEIKFNNRKHITKYLVYEKLGYCPPNTTLKERESILKDCLGRDLNSRSRAYETRVLTRLDDPDKNIIIKK